MEPYHSQTLKNALRLPALSWRLTFFGGHSQQVKAGWHIGTERHLAFELIQILAGSERVHLAQDAFVLTLTMTSPVFKTCPTLIFTSASTTRNSVPG